MSAGNEISRSYEGPADPGWDGARAAMDDLVAAHNVDGLRAAAAREFGRLDDEQSAHETFTGSCSQERQDRYDLASAVMADHPADEHEPATLDWLLAVGGTLGTAPAGNRYADFRVAGNEVDDDDPKWRVWLRLHEPLADGAITGDLFTLCEGQRPGGCGLVGHWPRTRGEVRRLFAALGVTTTEKPS